MLANSLAFALRRLAAHSLVARSLSSVASLSSQADGVDVTLNWALAKSGVTPKDRAFRNLDAKSLTAHVGKAEAADAKPQVVSVKDAASTAAYTTVMKKVVDHLNQQGSVFTHDGAIGSSGKDHVAVRAIGDNAQSAQIAAELLSVLPARAATQFTPSLTVFSVGSLALSAEERTALGLSASGAALFVNAAKGRVVVLGRVSAAALQSALNSVAAQALGANSSASATALVAAPSADFASLVVGAVDGAALTFLGRTGYSAAWKNAKGFGQDLANVWKSPVNLFLVAKDATGALPTVAKLSPAQARLFFAVNHASASSAGGTELAHLVERFGKLVAESNTNVYLVNQQLAANVSSVVSQVASSGLTGLTAEPSLGFGVPSSESGKVNAAAAQKLAGELTAKAKSLYPKLNFDGALAPLA